MDDILIIGIATFDDHLLQIDTVLQCLCNKKLQVNTRKSKWIKEEVDYLGFLIAPEGLKPQPEKTQGLLDMQEPNSVKELRSFLGMVNYYKLLWLQRSHILKPLPDMSGPKRCLNGFLYIRKPLIR